MKIGIKVIRRVKNNIHKFIALGANAAYRFPSRDMKVIGVTGTDGKTTTANLIYHLLHSSGYKVAMITTIGAVIDGKVYDTGFHVTTPSPILIQKYLSKAIKSGCTYVVLEVTSHGLDQNRAAGIRFDVGVLTNITHEHLDYHKTIDAYRRVKLKLFLQSKTCVINKDDDSYSLFSKILKHKKIISYSLTKNADYTPKRIIAKSSLIGEFNVSNTLAAIAAVEASSDITRQQIDTALRTFEGPIGRQNVVYKKDFSVMIDFAHTPNSIEKVLEELRKVTQGRLIHVFGSAGKRDYFKRPMMGKASSKYADIIVLTAEDPRGEAVEKISDEIIAGIDTPFVEGGNSKTNGSKKIYYVIPDRQKAIDFAIQLAKPGDYVVVTGKGHENSMNFGNGEISWDEFKAVNSAIEKKNANES